MRHALLTGFLVLSLMTMGFSGVVTADNTTESEVENECDAFFDTCTVDDLSGSIAGTMEGATDRFTYHIFTDDYRTAEDAADGFQDEFNANATNFTDAYNDRVSGGVDEDSVVELTFIDQEGDEETKYLIADYNGEELTTTEVVNEKPDDSDVDEELEITGLALEHADDELVEFNKEYIESDEMVDHRYMTEMYSKYGADIDGTIDLRTDLTNFELMDGSWPW